MIWRITVPYFYWLEFNGFVTGLKLGEKQNGEQVDDIALPPWSQSCSRLFTLVHRQALESDYVSSHLHQWIDLIFGYKQTGQAAIDAINVFHPAVSRDGVVLFIVK